jgi:2-polyprenyl-3-methyl-5-hydroxy-6-metoxy-1,4-benzoquinol methylase
MANQSTAAIDRQVHWERVYATRAEAEVSWFQANPGMSLDLIGAAGATPRAAIVDIGGGASRLVDALLGRGHGDVTVLAISAKALDVARTRLGAKSEGVQWVAADVTRWRPARRYDLWHDRAAFHFLTDEADRRAYVETLRHALMPRGHAIVATFAPDGPDRCSGLPIARYDAASLGAALGADFVLLDSRRQTHRTPGGAVQHFQFSLFRRD